MLQKFLIPQMKKPFILVNMIREQRSSLQCLQQLSEEVYLTKQRMEIFSPFLIALIVGIISFMSQITTKQQKKWLFHSDQIFTFSIVNQLNNNKYIKIFYNEEIDIQFSITGFIRTVDPSDLSLKEIPGMVNEIEEEVANIITDKIVFLDFYYLTNYKLDWHGAVSYEITDEREFSDISINDYELPENQILLVRISSWSGQFDGVRMINTSDIQV